MERQGLSSGMGAIGSGAGLSSRLDMVIDRALAEQRIVGTVTMVMHTGAPVYVRAAGLADREAGRPMTEDTVFRFSSVSKPIVTAAAMALIEQGKLSLDDAVTRWLPGFTPALPDGTKLKITIRQLLTHTAGLTYGFFEPADGPYHRAGVSDGMDQPGLSLEEELRRIVAAGLTAAPGGQWAYSVALDVLGAVLAAVEQAPLPDVVQQLVTGPLGMRDTAFSVKSDARLAVPYFQDGPRPPLPMTESTIVLFGEGEGIRFSPRRILDSTSFPSAGAGMAGTAGDVARFLEAIRTGGGGILKPETARAMMTGQIGVLPMPSRGPGWSFGFGGAVLTDPAVAAPPTPQSPGTWSWGGVYGHSWFVDPARELTVVVLTNTTTEGMVGRFPAEVRDAVYAR